MGELSRTLARIVRDCPVEFSLEEARIGQLFTPQAYEIMKRLELKSLLKRFEAGSQTQNQVERAFLLLDDLAGAETRYLRVKAEKAGLQLITEGNRVLGLALAFDEENIYFIEASGFLTGEYLAGKAAELLKRGGAAWVMDLKAMLPWLP